MTTPADILRVAANEIDALPIKHTQPEWTCEACRAHALAGEAAALAHEWENPEEESR